MKSRWLLFLFILSIFFNGYSQRKDIFIEREDSIVKLHKSILSEPNTILRYQKNEQLLFLLEETLDLKNSMSYPFDSLKTISVLTSPDRKIRIFSWYLVSDEGVHEHYGYLQAYNEEKKDYKLYSLIDKWKQINNPEAQVLSVWNWFGAMYTEIIEMNGINNKTYYTLLGWNGRNIFSQCKVIEIMSLNNKGVPVFGAFVFKGYAKKRIMRIVFEYAKRSPFVLHYEKQFYTQKSAKKDKKTNKYSVDTLSANMIIFNRLIPMDETLQDIPQFMVGEASLTDGFIEKDGKWLYIPDVIARNPDRHLPHREHKSKKFYTPLQ
ncbi:MAG: hypothetical protein LBE13_00025 [Bacteroidales bacterium]|jgi:hypothetical protein|nr:hypothetical protein [Bacteroidales bacterium]